MKTKTRHHPSRVSGGVTPVGTDGLIREALGALVTRWNLRQNAHRPDRKLEIGPGPQRIAGFETLNATYARHIDYVWDAGKPLPFAEGSFSLIYASHVLEHVPWYQTLKVLREWARILRPSGVLEIWVPNGLKICKAFVDAEILGDDPLQHDPWTRYNEEHDPCKWASGRIFTYGDGSGRVDDPNWHRALFSPRYLREVMVRAGLEDVREMDRREVRGYDHGWINLGMRGRKPAGENL